MVKGLSPSSSSSSDMYSPRAVALVTDGSSNFFVLVPSLSFSFEDGDDRPA